MIDSPWFPSSDRSRFKSCVWHLLWELEHVIFCFSHLYSKNCDTRSEKADLGIKDEIHLWEGLLPSRKPMHAVSFWTLLLAQSKEISQLCLHWKPDLCFEKFLPASIFAVSRKKAETFAKERTFANCKGKNWVKKAFFSILKWEAYIKTVIAEYFPSGPMNKNPSCNAEHKGSIPGRGTKIPHVSRQLSPRVATHLDEDPVQPNKWMKIKKKK